MKTSRFQFVFLLTLFGVNICRSACLAQENPVQVESDKPAVESPPSSPLLDPEAKPELPAESALRPKFNDFESPIKSADVTKTPTNIAEEPESKTPVPVATIKPAVAPSDRLESEDVLLIETKEGLSAFGKSLGKWDRVIVSAPQDGSSRLKQAQISPFFASVIVNDQLFGFSSRSGRWDNLKIPAEFKAKVIPLHGSNLLSAKIGDRTFALSPKTGKWTSPETEIQNEVAGANVDSGANPELQKPIITVMTAEMRRLTDDFTKNEMKAAQLAGQIRSSLKKKVIGEADSPSLLSYRADLKSALIKGLELKGKIDLLRIKELQARLSQMEQQIGRRQALGDQIVERRARELIEGDDTRWYDEAPATAPQTLVSTQPLQPARESLRTTPDTLIAESAMMGRPRDAGGRMMGSASSARDPSSTPKSAVRPDTSKPVKNKKSPNEFFVMNEDGTDLKSLFLYENHPVVGSPAVSPDGEWIAFDDVAIGNGGEFIYVMTIEGKDVRRICSGMMPTWSSDNRFLVCTRKEPTYGIWMVDTASQERRFLRQANGAQWGPSSMNIAMTMNQELSIFNLKTGGNTSIMGNRVNPFVHINSNGTWSPDGKMYCFVGQRSSGLREIATVTMSGKNDIANLKIHHTFQANLMTDFAWHPDGQRIVCSLICPLRHGLRQLYEFNPNQVGSIDLVAGQDETRNNIDMCWTPDGKRLIFVSGDYSED